ncbi:MAG: prephenate dehydratase [Magnetococcales bacterium]|nr:prephenate dehydratase [Magnetococcales bacterium]MBF0149974.1 prephenate dehydratase [Magnetococcales bacterium]MBF0173628.1 prephenate dehydratase [Magnetococcales bacterium]
MNTTVTLEDLRHAIDGIDDRIHDLLMERAQWVLKVGELKGRTSQNPMFYRPEREAGIHRRLEARHHGPLPVAAVHRVFREIISASLNLEKSLSVVYLGPEATFTHQAAIKQFGSSFRMYPAASIHDVFHEVEVGRADFGVTPVESSSEGVVHHTLKRLADSPLRICGEIYLPVIHTLLSLETGLDQVTCVFGHPQALDQCRGWLASHLPGIATKEEESTARSVLRARETPNSAAIAGVYAADAFGLNLLAEHLQDQAGNEHRFLVIGRHAPSRSGTDKTCIMFSFSDQPGFLHKVLGIFATHGINLTAIQSIPSRGSGWGYAFFLDFDGHQEDPEPSQALAELAAMPGVDIKIFGSFPRPVQ